MLNDGNLALWCALNQLLADYWADVDQNDGHQAHDFYLPDGLYAIGNNRFEGKGKDRNLLHPTPERHHYDASPNI